MQLVFSVKQNKIVKPIVPVNEVEQKTQSTKKEIFSLPPQPNPFQYMIHRIQFENPHCNSCGK
jgi:hypothetical protein